MLIKHRCKNGIRIVLEKIPTVRSVSIGIWIGTGSRYETERNNGISHFLEHMLFKGTKTRTAREIAEAFDKIGGFVNAFTSKEYTCFFSKVLDEHAEYALDILSDMFFESTFSDEEIAREKGVVLEEIKMYEDTPDEIVHDLLGEATYGSHPLSYRILGTEQSLHTFNRETLESYKNDRYTADNIVISIAGHVNESMIKAIEERFGALRSHVQKAEHPSPPFLTEKAVRKKETEQAHLCLGFVGLPLGSDDIYHLIVLNNIVGGSMSSRLFQEVREERGLAYSIFSYHSAYRDHGMLTVYGGTGREQVDALYETIAQQLKEIGEKGITERELANSIEQLKGNLMLSLESTNSRMSRNGKNELLLGQHWSLDEMIEKLNHVTIENVNRLAERIFSSGFSCSLVSPDGKLPKAIHS